MRAHNLIEEVGVKVDEGVTECSVWSQCLESCECLPEKVPR
jgi:hypothetical protein